MKKTNGTSPIFICPLPRGRHHISKVLQENPGRRKCGYEEPCVIQKGLDYNFSTDVWGQKENIGTMKIETWGHDTNWVVYKPEMFKAQDFIESTLMVDESNKVCLEIPKFVNLESCLTCQKLSCTHWLPHACPSMYVS